MTRRRVPGPPQLELNLGPFNFAPGYNPDGLASIALKCPYMAGRHTQDQYRCAECGRVWDIDEERPPCKFTDTFKG